jgi:hypothetical protein
LGQKAVQRFQHKAVTAEGNDQLGLLGFDARVGAFQVGQSLLRSFGLGRDNRDAGRGPRRWNPAHPPVTLI